MNKQNKTVSTVDLISGMDALEKEIQEKINNYNLLRNELIRRFPPLENEEAFKLHLTKNGDEDVKTYNI